MGAVRDYYVLTKPGIVYGNLVHTLAGVALGIGLAGWHWRAAMGGTIGIALFVAAACVFNNIIDRTIDARMRRTQNRPLVTGKISPYRAAIFGLALLLAGILTLLTTTPYIVTCLGVVAFVWYVIIYGLAKRTTPLSTIIGSVPGALPPVAGYCAITGGIDMNALLIFASVTVWQMPHFHAIGIYRRREYKEARLPIMASKLTNTQLAWVMVLYGIIYTELLVGMVRTGLFHPVPGGIFVILGVVWTIMMGRGIFLKTSIQYVAWARKVFGASLLLSVAFFTLSMINLVFS